MGLIHYENDFSTLIKDKAVVDFYATWCGPCRMFGPVFEEVSKDKDFYFFHLYYAFAFFLLLLLVLLKKSLVK